MVARQEITDDELVEKLSDPTYLGMESPIERASRCGLDLEGLVERLRDTELAARVVRQSFTVMAALRGPEILDAIGARATKNDGAGRLFFELVGVLRETKGDPVKKLEGMDELDRDLGILEEHGEAC